MSAQWSAALNADHLHLPECRGRLDALDLIFRIADGATECFWHVVSLPEEASFLGVQRLLVGFQFGDQESDLARDVLIKYMHRHLLIVCNTPVQPLALLTHTATRNKHLERIAVVVSWLYKSETGPR